MTMNEAALRARWLRLTRTELPEAARGRPEWPIRLDHCFGRVILDAVCGLPWREVLAAPAWRNLDAEQLRAAVALAEAVLAGSADLDELNSRSLMLRKTSRAARGHGAGLQRSR